MSGVARPKGKLPARIYWVRRALVLGVLALIVFLVAQLFKDDSDASSKPTGEEQRTEPVQRSEAAAPESTVTAAATPSETPLATPDGPCAPSEVLLTPQIVSEPAGGPRIEVPMTVTTERAACTFVVSSNSVVVKISQDGGHVFSSQHCPQVVAEQSLVVRAAKPASAMITWNGRFSNEECDDRTAGWARAGNYQVLAAPFGGEPSEKSFELTRPQAPVVVKTRKPKPTTSSSPTGSGTPSSN